MLGLLEVTVGGEGNGRGGAWGSGRGLWRVGGAYGAYNQWGMRKGGVSER